MITPAQIGEILHDANKPVLQKIQELLPVLTQSEKSPETYAKMLCWLSYRKLAGYELPDLSLYIEWHLEVLKSCSQRTRAIWTQSLEMIRCYNAVKNNNMIKAAEYAKASLLAYDKEVNPGGIVNALRACLIGRLPNKMLNLFKESACLFPTEYKPWLIECLTKSARCLEIEAWLKVNESIAVELEKEEPFHTLFKQAMKESWYLVEERKYSMLYEGGYGPAQPNKVVLLGECQPTDIALDLGCGEALLSHFFNNYTGVDISSVAIERNKQRRKGVYYQSSLDQLSFLTQTFDVVVCSDVLEHIPESKLDAVLNSIRSVKSHKYLFAISCRESVTKSVEGEQLHLTVKEPEWWEHKLSELFLVTVLEKHPTWVVFKLV